MPAAPWSRSHSTVRIPKAEFDGSFIVLRYENTTGSRATSEAASAIRRSRVGPLAWRGEPARPLPGGRFRGAAALSSMIAL